MALQIAGSRSKPIVAAPRGRRRAQGAPPPAAQLGEAVVPPQRQFAPLPRRAPVAQPAAAHLNEAIVPLQDTVLQIVLKPVPPEEVFPQRQLGPPVPRVPVPLREFVDQSNGVFFSLLKSLGLTDVLMFPWQLCNVPVTYDKMDPKHARGFVFYR